jgi:hypothetical protein
MLRLLALTTLLAACGQQGLDDPRFATGSSSMVAAREAKAVYTVDVDEGTLSRVDIDGRIRSVKVGGEPTRVAMVGDELWVTLRSERAVAVVSDRDGELTVESVMDVGAEPTGVVATENGKRVYVAVSQQDVVVEFDGRTKAEKRRFAVMDDPRFLALHPSDRVLYVASPYARDLMWIDLVEGNVFPMDTPDAQRGTERGPVDLVGRFTGDPSFSVDGESLALPMLYVDNETPVDSPDEPTDRPTSGYGSSGVGVSRMNPTLLVIPTDPKTGVPETEVDEQSLVFLPSFISSFTEEATIVRSYPSSVTGSPSGDEWVVTFEGSDAVSVVDRDPSDQRGVAMASEPSVSTDAGFNGGGDRFEIDPESAGFTFHAIQTVRTGAAPRAVAFLDDDDAYVHEWMSRAVVRYPFDQAADLLRGRGDGQPLEMTHRKVIGDSALDADVEAGRRLFFSAADARMAGSGAGVSCGTCHFDGRNDGLTWTLNGEMRQTPSLAGPVHLTAPVTWADGVASVADEAMLTTSLRMGGGGLTEDEAGQIEAYVRWSRLPDVALAGVDNAQIRLGREVFERADVGCATCHSGEQFTDNRSHPLYSDLPTQTPTLRGISATAPYLHDGSVRTLRDLLEKVRDGSMGDTSSLAPHELDALEAYLRSL